MTRIDIKTFLKILVISTLVVDVVAVIIMLPAEPFSAGWGIILLLTIGMPVNSILTTILTKRKIPHLDLGQMFLIWLITFAVTGFVLYFTLGLTVILSR